MKRIRGILLAFIGAILLFSVSVSTKADAIYNEAFAVSASARLTNGATVKYTAALPAVPASDDGLLYLYALQPYEYAVTATDILVGTVNASTNPTFTAAVGPPNGISDIDNAADAPIIAATSGELS